jgi:transcriptional regulator with XRE-family HTH domain
MMTKKRILPPDRLAECEAAHGLFLSKKNELKLSQKKIADAAGMTPAAVNLYFKGINPLNAQFAAVLARMIHEPVEAFSPRLAEEIRDLTSAPVKAGDMDDAPAGSAADIVQDMLSRSGKNLSEDARRRLLEAAQAEDRKGVIELDYYRPGLDCSLRRPCRDGRRSDPPRLSRGASRCAR